jgi:glycosidase
MTEKRIGWELDSERRPPVVAWCIAIAVIVAIAPWSTVRAQDVSQPAILQMFEAKWDTIEDRMADIFETGYGQMWLPPPERADGGNQSVGYDLFDRFDLGQPRNETLYGTETGLKTTIAAGHGASVRMYTDFVPNHNGFRNKNTSGFVAQGGYPGFVLSTASDQFGDFHDPSVSYQSDAINGSLFGLIDIAQEKNIQLIRQPVAAGNPDNIPAGTVWNKPDPNNARFYTDTDLGGIAMNDPNTGGAFTRYNFNLNNPLAGDARKENATGLLMRNMQWMIQVMGVDGFRIDAARHMPTWFFNYLDNAVFRTSLRTNLDGTIQPIYMFSEAADGTSSNVQPYIRRDLPNKLGISTSDTTVHGNRDALDFPLFWKMVDNLSSNGTQNNWHNIRNASLDVNDDGLHNGSQGVMFVDSHDDQAGQRPSLYKVAYAYTLMMPGNTVVYLNAKEFGEGRTFPYDIGGSTYSMSNDALGGYWGDDLTKLVDIRNTHGRGNFQERWIDDAFNPNGFSNIYIYERQNSAIVGLNSRADAGYDQRTPVQTSFAANTVLVELTGNAADATVDPGNNIPEAIRVNASGQVTIRVPRNSTHGKGYVIYGLASPQGTLSLTNVSQTLAGATPTQANNGTARLADIDVITGNTFNVQLNTTPVTLPAPSGEANPVRDVHADGDLAMLRIDDSLNINGVAGIDNTNTSATAYGFENFMTTNTPGYIWSNGANVGTGSGTFVQTIDATQLAEGRHYLTVRAWRHRASNTGGDGGPAVFTDFKRTFYVDRLPPTSAIVSFAPFASNPNNVDQRDLIVRSVDGTADSVHVFLDLPANMTNAQILAEMNNANSQYNHLQAGTYDRDMFISGFSQTKYFFPSQQTYNGVTRGNHVVTLVTYEPTGNYSIQRFAGQFTPTTIGLGFGDMNFSGSYIVGDIRTNTGSVEDVLYSQNSKFSSAFDLNGDGLNDNRDLFLLSDVLVAAPTSAFGGSNKQGVLDAYTDLLLKRADVNSSGASDITDMAALYAGFGTTSWLDDLNVDGVVDIADAQTMVTKLFRTVAGDFNLDGQVDAADYTIWRKNQGQNGATFLQGDATFDGVIGSDDLAVWRANFGFARQALAASGNGASLTAVPEPAALWLALIGMAWAFSLRWRISGV